MVRMRKNKKVLLRIIEVRRYGNWIGNPKGTKEDTSRCIASVFSSYRFNQCSRKRGHGEGGLYCKQHDPVRIADKDAKQLAKWKIEWAASEKAFEKPKAFCKALEKIASGELNDPAGYAQMTLDKWS